jgi:AcrR family transcriptional regulator
MARKTPEESEQTRLKLMEAGMRMFAKYGYAYSTLDDIAQCAGLSRGAVYWHFKGKGELLQSILGASVFPLEAFFVPGADLAQGFEHFAKALHDTLAIQCHRDLCTILLKEGELGAPQCPVVMRWRAAQENLGAQLKLLLAAQNHYPVHRTLAEFEALVHLMELSITGLLVEALHSTQTPEQIIGPFVQTLKELAGGVGVA